MNIVSICANSPLIRPSGTFSPRGIRQNRSRATRPFSPRVEGGGSRMRGPHAPLLAVEHPHG